MEDCYKMLSLSLCIWICEKFLFRGETLASICAFYGHFFKFVLFRFLEDRTWYNNAFVLRQFFNSGGFYSLSSILSAAISAFTGVMQVYDQNQSFVLDSREPVATNALGACSGMMVPFIAFLSTVWPDFPLLVLQVYFLLAFSYGSAT